MDLNYKQCQNVYLALMNTTNDIVVLSLFNPGSDPSRIIKVKVPNIRIRMQDEVGEDVEADMICDNIQ